MNTTAYGNITRLTETGGESLTLTISYANDLNLVNLYRVALPSTLKAHREDGTLLRHRTAEYDAKGRMATFTVYPASAAAGYTSRIEWNAAGQLASITGPLGTQAAYTYDPTDTYPITVTQSGRGVSPHISHMAYFYEWGVLQSRTDPNGLAEHFEYDAHGRRISHFTPYDAAIPAVSYEYTRDSNSRMTARTATKVTLDPADPSIIETLILIDGLGRPIYTAKSGYIANPGYTGSDYGSTASGTLGWNLSGAIRCDAKGRTIAQGQPIFAPGKANPPFPLMINPTLTTYDGLDRPLKVQYPSSDGPAITAYSYRIENQQAITRVIDPEGSITETAMDPLGRIIGITRGDPSSPLAKVLYTYDPISQLEQVIQHTPQGDYTVHFSYDLRGLQTEMTSPETGKTVLHYDERGSLIEKSTPNLRSAGKVITYAYDGLGRLLRTRYPDMDNVTYTYGDPEIPEHKTIHAIGRILSRTDQSGSIKYTYGKMGEVVQEERTLNSQRYGNSLSAVTGFQSDYLGRISQVIYSDGEVIDYGYDPGGQLISVEGTRTQGTSKSLTTFVKNIGYDTFGQRTFILHGNGVRTDYTYDEERRWLEGLKSANSYGQTLQNLEYTFDKVGSITTRTATPPSNTATVMTVSTNSPRHQEITLTIPTAQMRSPAPTGNGATNRPTSTMHSST